MGVNSYAEIFTTLIGWHLYGVIWDVLAATGIVFLPFLWILIDNWRNAFVDGEEGGGASAGLRALEVELYIGLFVMLIACVPNGITTLNRADVFYAPPATTANPSPVTATTWLRSCSSRTVRNLSSGRARARIRRSGRRFRSSSSDSSLK